MSIGRNGGIWTGLAAALSAILVIALAVKDVAQILPRQIFHDDVELVGVAVDVIELDDVGVAQGGREARLIQEHLHEVGVFSQVLENAFDDHQLLEAGDPLLSGEKDFRHPANGDSACKLVPG